MSLDRIKKVLNNLEVNEDEQINELIFTAQSLRSFIEREVKANKFPIKMTIKNRLYVKLSRDEYFPFNYIEVSPTKARDGRFDIEFTNTVRGRGIHRLVSDEQSIINFLKINLSDKEY